jgi:hypothetical protein
MFGQDCSSMVGSVVACIYCNRYRRQYAPSALCVVNRGDTYGCSKGVVQDNRLRWAGHSIQESILNKVSS